MAGNLPPGAENDPRAPYNQKDHSHEHEWFDGGGPIIEDGAAIFYEECQYAEGRWGEGWECEETRSRRLPLESVTKKRDGVDITYLASEFESFYRVMEAGLIAAEQDGEITSCDPDPEYGQVVVETEDWKVIYD